MPKIVSAGIYWPPCHVAIGACGPGRHLVTALADLHRADRHHRAGFQRRRDSQGRHHAYGFRYREPRAHRLDNDAGRAELPLLLPGSYDIALTAAGFEQLVRRGIVVHVGDIVTLPLTLTPGNATEQITVVGETPLLEEKSVTLGQLMEEREIVQLPLNGRNYLDLGRLAGGAVPSQGSRDQTFSAYGNTGLQNAFLLDGARNENYLRGLDNRARDMLRPTLDALSEFQVQTSNFSAEFGASAGAIITAITKSGTNQWHGSACDFLPNDRLDASNFFAQPGSKRSSSKTSTADQRARRLCGTAPGSSARTKVCTPPRSRSDSPQYPLPRCARQLRLDRSL